MIQVNFFLHIDGLPLYLKKDNLRSSRVDFQGGYIKMKLKTYDELEYVLKPNNPSHHSSYLLAISQYENEWKEWKLVKQNPGLNNHIYS